MMRTLGIACTSAGYAMLVLACMSEDMETGLIVLFAAAGFLLVAAGHGLRTRLFSPHFRRAGESRRLMRHPF